MQYTTVLFDFDSTLYPNENGYEAHTRQNIYEFMHQRLGVPRDECKEVHAKLFAQTNQTLKALRDVGGYQFDREEYFAFTRAGCEQFLTPDDGVKTMLAALAHKQLHVFTNADETGASTGLQVLEIADHFGTVYGSRFMSDVCKPDHEAFRRVVAATGAKLAETVFVDDSLRNIKAAKELGITTVYVANRSRPREEWEQAEVKEFADYVVPFTTHDEMFAAFPALFATDVVPAAV